MIAGLLISVIIAVMLFFGYKGINSIFDDQGAIQSRTNTADAGRIVDITQIAAALENFSADHSGEYPGYLESIIGEQLKSMPSDPNGIPYTYAVAPDRSRASIYAILETKRLYCWRSKDRVAKEVESVKFCQP